MSPGLPAWGRKAAYVGSAAGLAVAGAAVGLAAERYAVGRSFRKKAAAWPAEPYGEIRGEPVALRSTDGVLLHAEVSGAADPPITVIFSHGLALTQDSWHHQRRDLADLGRLVFWDQRGHGESARGAPENATIDQLGRDLRSVIDATAPEGPIVLVGHSMGGMTVMALADQEPELFGSRVTGVALLNTSPGKLAEVTFGVPAAAGRVLRRAAPKALVALNRSPQLVRRTRTLGSDLEYVFTKRYSFATDVSPRLVQFVQQMHDCTPLDVLAELFPAFDAHDKLAALPVLDGVETLIMAAEQDLMTPADHSRQMVDKVPGAELVVVPDAGHLLMLEHPRLVSLELRQLIERACRAGQGAAAG